MDSVDIVCILCMKGYVNYDKMLIKHYSGATNVLGWKSTYVSSAYILYQNCVYICISMYDLLSQLRKDIQIRLLSWLGLVYVYVYVYLELLLHCIADRPPCIYIMIIIIYIHVCVYMHWMDGYGWMDGWMGGWICVFMFIDNVCIYVCMYVHRAQK